MTSILSYKFSFSNISISYNLFIRAVKDSNKIMLSTIYKLSDLNIKFLVGTLYLSLLLTACAKDKRTSTKEMSLNKGTISGTISPVGKAIAVHALSQENISYSAVLEANGTFKFHDLPNGTYSIDIVPAAGFTARSSIPTNVTARHDTNIGTLLVYESSGSNSLNYLSYNVNDNAGKLRTVSSCSYIGLNITISAQLTELRQNRNSLISPIVVDQLDIVLDNVTGKGIYNCKGTPSSTIRLSNRKTSPFGVSPLYIWNAVNAGGSGIVEINAVDPINRTITGTFSASLVPESSGATGIKLLSNGVFTNVAY